MQAEFATTMAAASSETTTASGTLLYELQLHGSDPEAAHTYRFERPLGPEASAWHEEAALPSADADETTEPAPPTTLATTLFNLNSRQLPALLWQLSLRGLEKGLELAEEAAFGGTPCHAQQRLLAELPAWQLALSPGGELLALWRHADLLLLSPRDNFARAVATWASGADAVSYTHLTLPTKA